MGVIFSRLIGESKGVGEDGADEDIGVRKGDSDDDDDEDDEEEMDGSDSVRSQQLFLLFMLLSLSILTSLIM